MHMKKFVAPDLQSGWIEIYREFGEDAIIISIKEIDGKFEIIAATPVEKEDKEHPKSILEQITSEFKSEEDTEGVEDILSLAINLKTSKPDIKRFISNFVNQHFSNISKLENRRKLIEEKAESKSLQKRFINILGGVATGKSTTAVKIIANLKFTEGKKVALASFDYFKVGGFETVKRFCEIMQVPFFQIKSKKDLIMFKDDFEMYEYVVFDTPGNLGELEDTFEIVKLLSESENTENILTVSLDKKETVIKKEISFFSSFNISSVILTKFDEVSLEEFLMTLSNIPYKVSFITNGLNVPNDIMPVSKLIEKVEV